MGKQMRLHKFEYSIIITSLIVKIRSFGLFNNKDLGSTKLGK